ncbi:NAD(P)-dependent dehydrogenase (short-subunit alcohol dehydrogenase family) [Nocardia transvalensis]|uniref:NAD(P)-dependent dehydrogenase (Short-subunit alcohol dehydrogenase family) n=1 Tax=Nocardia transvalensis TaxID=37333 RepID=A0A7W9PJU8_9NOCA|nr:SDR family oxidoreductase [Nocardia transvalensis]MBB5917497.1 NAD(P)-dependent dehydrogenase (short-subunit alcohol dehydrogenase family) [Nocardia transvalensis]
MTSIRLDGKRVLITGASRGIGADLAESFAEAGATLVLSGRDAEALDVQARKLRERFGIRAEAVAADLSEPEAPRRLAAAAAAVFGGLDVLINNAGISHPEPVTALTAEAFDEVLTVNLRAPALLAAEIGSAMAESGGGSLVTIASAAALHPLTEHYAYSTSKAGIVMATRVLALELGPRGVRANSLCPTVVLTDMGRKVWGEEAKSAPMLARIPLGRFAVPAEVSATALFLASDLSSMINGTEIPIDGGYGVS